MALAAVLAAGCLGDDDDGNAGDDENFDAAVTIDSSSTVPDAPTIPDGAPPPDAAPPDVALPDADPLPTFGYRSLCDSPFELAGMGTDAFADTLEDGALDIPGVTTSTGSVIGPGGLTDSVDGDDGVLDESGTNGRSFFSIDGSTGITITFDAKAIGFAPTQAGVVWTDGGGTTNFEAFDPMGNSLGTQSGMHADGSFSGTTVDDFFYGVNGLGEVGSIHISNTSGGIEIDHIQFARPSALTDDCNSNGMPDKCELVGNDTNGNAIPDDCDPTGSATPVSRSAPAAPAAP